MLQKNSNIYTDLALEAHEIILDKQKTTKEEYEIDGVELSVSTNQDQTVKTTWVKVLNDEGSKQMGKPIGNYITIESEAMPQNDTKTHEEIIKILAKHITQVTSFTKEEGILVVGLGNWQVTPDALGPKTIEKVLVTRHLPKEALPEQLHNLGKVSAISPGVMGVTGIETAEIIKGIIDRTKPSLVIAVDALAARNINRINSTIQISDTGLAPGAGMGNKRAQINESTMGVPVIAIGVPTVVDAATLVNDTMEHMLEDIVKYAEEGTTFYEMLKNLGEKNRYPLIKELLSSNVGNMFVTPKEINAVIERLANVIANALNIAIHPSISVADINRYS